MIVIYESKLTDEQIKNYRSKGYRIATAFDKPYILQGEAVGFVLDTLYKDTIDLITKLLYRNDKLTEGFLKTTKNEETNEVKTEYIKHTTKNKVSKITIKLDDKTYELTSLTEWSYTCQSDTDPLKQVTKKHPVYQAYLDNRKEYIAKQKAKKLSDEYELHFIDIPEEELTLFLSANAKYYGISVDFNNKIDMFKAYQQIKYYQEHDIPVEYEEPEEVEYFGDVTYLEDMIYKNAKDSC
jgi:hypothetical protein